MQSIVQLNFKNLVASALLSASLLQSVGPVLLNYLSELDIPPRQAAYFIGFLIGYIIETAISLIFTGGSLTLASVLREAFVAPARALACVGKVALRAGYRFTKNQLESLIQLINEGLPELIRKLNDPKGFLDEVVEGVNSILGNKKVSKLLDNSDIAWMQRRNKPHQFGGEILNFRELKKLRELLETKYGVSLVNQSTHSSFRKFKPIRVDVPSKVLPIFRQV